MRPTPFVGIRRRAGDASIALDAVQKRRPFFVNQLDVARYPWLASGQAHAAMAAPLVVSGEVIGAITFLRSAPGAGFDDDALAKVTILASQLGTALEALRLNQLSREEHRRASILVEVATALHGLPDTAAVVESIADRLRAAAFARRARLRPTRETVPVAGGVDRSRPARTRHPFAFPAERPALCARDREPRRRRRRAHYGQHRRRFSFWRRLAARSSHRRALSHLALARCDSGLPPPRQPFHSRRQNLVSALAGFGAVAIANAELYGMARAQAHELHEILEISFELGSAGKLDEFMQTSVVRAASFLGFERCFIGLLEEAAFHIRWGVENGVARPVDIPLYDGVATAR
jgi:hypothetical protein